jgi:aspartyl-tRNA(Asn)/glutamyl-tRNA(Gln) amidotransferase subunit A
LSLRIAELVAGYRKRRFSPVDIARELIDREERRRALNCFCWFDAERLLTAARDAEQRLSPGRTEASLMTGVPIALKDNIDTAGIPTTGGSAAYLERIPDTDAIVWRRLKDRGALLVGKAVLSELAIGSVPSPHFGVVLNPRNPEHSPGSSSSGSAAAVAAELAAGSLGTDTGGSVRVPATFCGLVGLKPTYDRVERTGVLPLAWSLDAIGPITQTVTDATILLDAMSLVPTGALQPGSLTLAPIEPDQLRIGVTQDVFPEAPQPEIVGAWEAAVSGLQHLGCRIEKVTIADLRASQAAHRVIMASEAFAQYAQGLNEGLPFGAPFRDAVEPGRHLPAHMYLDAQRWRRLMMRQMRDLMTRIDVILTPTTSWTAPSLTTVAKGWTPSSQITYLASFTGQPAITVPWGADVRGLPIGLQLMGRAGADGDLLRAAALLERCAAAATS